MNRYLKKYLSDEICNVSITDVTGKEVGRKIASFFGRVYEIEGVEVEEDEFYDFIETDRLRWEKY